MHFKKRQDTDSVISKDLLHLRPLQREGLFQLQNTHTAPQGWVTVPRMAGGIGGTLVRTSVHQMLLVADICAPLDNTSSREQFLIIRRRPRSAFREGHQFSHGWLVLAIQAKMGPLLARVLTLSAGLGRGCLSHLPLSFETSDLHSGCRQLHTAQILQPPPKLQCHCTCC